jgi:protoporphyrinogen oxidase
VRGTDVVVLGAGPAGLGAALALTRAGADVALVEGAPRVGGLSATRWRQGFGYDLGGHIPFVRDEARRRWLVELLGPDLLWVDRPVACVRGARVARGRYLDQEPAALAPEPTADDTADRYLARRFSDALVTEGLRPYLEKVDGIPLERLPALRVHRLLVDQAAPEGFWFPRRGIGQLMDAMAAAVRRGGGRVTTGARVTAVHAPHGRVEAVEVEGPNVRTRVGARHLVVGVPAARVALLVRPGPPAAAVPKVPARAVCLVVLALDRARLTPEPWIQVADPRAPFARLAELPNWSPALAPPGRTALSLECYCAAEPDDPVWGRTDEVLAAACAEALVGPLGLLEDASAARLVEVVRVANAYPAVAVDRQADALAPARWLAGLSGVVVAQGRAVIEAIEAGEAAAALVAGEPLRAAAAR